MMHFKLTTNNYYEDNLINKYFYRIVVTSVLATS